MNKIIQNWFENEYRIVTYQNPVSIHLNDLLGDNLTKNNVVYDSVNLFLDLAELLKLKQVMVIPLLTIPLQSIGADMSMNVPANLSALENELDDEPPSLYMLNQGTLTYPENCEEYRFPLPFDLISPLPNYIYAYYREFRFSQEIINHWELSRCIYVWDIHPEFFKAF